MLRHVHAALLAGGLLTGTAAAAFAEVSDADRQFIEQAVMGGHAEVSDGETAAKSENAAVAAFGRQMVTDHTQMNGELATIAKGLGVTPPDSASMTQQAKGMATGVLLYATFDRTYVDQQLSGHKETLGLLQNQATNGGNPELKAFAEKYIPVVEQHIAELERLQQQLGQG